MKRASFFSSKEAARVQIRLLRNQNDSSDVRFKVDFMFLLNFTRLFDCKSFFSLLFPLCYGL